MMKKRIWKICAGITAASLCFAGTAAFQNVFTELPAVYAASGYEGEMLSLGSYGESVAYVQQLLANLGYAIYVDGDYGEQTQSTVLAFQYDYGLYTDGIAGPLTVGMLLSASGISAEPSVQASQQSNGSLSLGSAGEQVAYVQQLLQNNGYPTLVDGDFGPATQNSVFAFQRDRGLYVDGIVGPITLNALETGDVGPAAASSFVIDVSRGSTGDAVSQVQQALADLGYLNSQVDGEFGPYTEAAVFLFQQKNGLTADGWVGPITAEVLFGDPIPNTAPASVGTSDLSEVRSAARAVLDQVGWDLYAAFEWSAGLIHDIDLDIGYQTSVAALYSFRHDTSNCIGMSSAFCYMARELGCTARVILGQVPYARGVAGEHAWVEIDYDGNTYVCDPSFERQMKRNGYMIHYGQSGTWKYEYGYILGD